MLFLWENTNKSFEVPCFSVFQKTIAYKQCVQGTICDRNVALRTKPSRTKLFLKELYIFSLANERQTSLCTDFHVLSILRLFIKSLGEEHLKSPFYWCSYWCTVCVWSHFTVYLLISNIKYNVNSFTYGSYKKCLKWGPPWSMHCCQPCDTFSQID